MSSGESGNVAWVTEEEADAYFETRYGATQYWSVSGVDKAGALATAQRDIESAKGYDFADYLTEPTAAMKNAVCEQALFLIRFPEAEERTVLRAQGVVSAGVVEEAYRNGGDAPVIAPRAVFFLCAHADSGANSFEFSR